MGGILERFVVHFVDLCAKSSRRRHETPLSHRCPTLSVYSSNPFGTRTLGINCKKDSALKLRSSRFESRVTTTEQLSFHIYHQINYTNCHLVS